MNEVEELEWLDEDDVRDGKLNPGDLVVNDRGSMYVVASVVLPFIRVGYVSGSQSSDGYASWKRGEWRAARTFDLRDRRVAQVPREFLLPGEIKKLPADARLKDGGCIAEISL